MRYVSAFLSSMVDGADLSEQLGVAVRNIEGEISETDLPDIEISEQVSIPADPNVKNHTYTLVDGEVYFRENSRMVKPVLNQTAMERRLVTNDYYDELLKDADVMDYCFYNNDDPVAEWEVERCNKLLIEFGVKHAKRRGRTGVMTPQFFPASPSTIYPEVAFPYSLKSHLTY